MKSIKSLLLVAAASLTLAVTVNAVERPLYPKAETRPAVVNTGAKDPNLLENLGQGAPRGRAAHPVVAGSSQKDPNLLNCIPMGKATCTKVMTGGACCKM